MLTDNLETIDSLREKNREFKRLEEQHKEYEAQLDELMRHAYLTPQQETFIQRIKKEKLWTKDRMAEIIKEFNSGAL